MRDRVWISPIQFDALETSSSRLTRKLERRCGSAILDGSVDRRLRVVPTMLVRDQLRSPASSGRDSTCEDRVTLVFPNPDRPS